MTLRLNSTGGGYVEIDAPNTASNFSLTAPIANGTLDRLERAGNILQVVTSNHQFFGSTPILVSKDTTAASALYGSAIPNRAYASLTSVTITPTYANSVLLFNATAGGTSTGRSDKGAQGIIIVKNNTTAYDTSLYPFYDSNTSLMQTSYPPDYHLTMAIPAGDTSAQTFYLKGFAYNEAGGSITHVARFVSTSLSIVEVKA